jgi:hypothetical protein
MFLLDKTFDHQRSVSASDGSLGTTRTWSTQNASVPCAIWTATSALAQDMYGGIAGDFLIATNSDIGVKAQDRFYDGSAYYYRVNGFKLFGNAAITSESLLLIDVTRRTV